VIPLIYGPKWAQNRLCGPESGLNRPRLHEIDRFPFWAILRPLPEIFIPFSIGFLEEKTGDEF
jgi:hypothetical protein